MAKNITLRLDAKTYRQFYKLAAEENRSVANLIETFALNKLNEELFTDTFETQEIVLNKRLQKKLKQGHRDASLKKGRFVA